MGQQGGVIGGKLQHHRRGKVAQDGCRRFGGVPRKGKALRAFGHFQNLRFHHLVAACVQQAHGHRYHQRLRIGRGGTGRGVLGEGQRVGRVAVILGHAQMRGAGL